jgi:ribosomal protein L12E/L44/L45/RPP1/RPP2
MSNDVNTAILERIGEEVAELTIDELLEELGLEQWNRKINVLTPGWRRVELEERLSKQRWEEYPDGPI